MEEESEDHSQNCNRTGQIDRGRTCKITQSQVAMNAG